MNRQEIIEMLESIGVTAMAMRPTSFKGYVDVFQKFADIVAAKEREECAKVCEAMELPKIVHGVHPDYIVGKEMAFDQAAHAIRARGQQ